MKKRMVRLAVLGLSTIFITSTVSLTVHATEASGISEGSVSAPEIQDYSPSEETIENDAADLEEYKYQQTVDEDTVVQNPTEGFDFDEAQQIIDGAVQSTDEAMQTSADVTDETDNVVTTVSDENVTADEANTAIENAEESVDDAKATVDAAQNNYSAALDAYNQAVNAYNAILDKYNNEKELTVAQVQEAKAELEAAQADIDALESQLYEAQQELVDASKKVFYSRTGSSSGNNGVYVGNDPEIENYITSIIKYNYIPSTENMTSEHRITRFSVYENDAEEGDDNRYITVEYTIINSDGDVIRESSAEFRYEIVEGEVKVYTREKTYSYYNKDGEKVTLTAEEAEALSPENQIEIDSYYTTSGKYVLRYVDENRNYTHSYPGTENFDTIDSQAINDGLESVKDEYINIKESPYYNVEAEFVDGYKSTNYRRNTVDVDINYNVYYDVVGDYGYVSDSLSQQHFASEEEAKAAVLEEMLSTTKGVYGIDFSASEDVLHIDKKPIYAYIITEYTEKELDADLSNKISGYYMLSNSIRSAKMQVASSAARYNALLEQLQAVENTYTGIIDTRIIVDAFEQQLDKAEENYLKATDNLYKAEENLVEAKIIYGSRFSDAPEIVGGEIPEVIETPVAPEEPKTIEAPEIIVEEPEITTEPEFITEPETTPDAGDAPNIFYSIPEEEQPEEEEENSVEIQDEDVPLAPYIGTFGTSHSNYGVPSEVIEDVIVEPEAEEQTGEQEAAKEEEQGLITLAGIMKRGKWFIALGGLTTAGISIAVFEAKRRAAIKLLDKLNQ